MASLDDVSLILAAHGSEAASDSNAPVMELAKQIASRGIFASVTPAFLLGQPNMSNVLDHVSDNESRKVVVPLMTSAGYYLNSVIPKRLAENKNSENTDWHISPVAGMHPQITELMIDRIHLRLSENEIVESETTIVLIGHGTRRNRNSAKSTFALFEKIKHAFPDARNRVAFLDQDPEAPLVAASIVQGHTIVVPFLVSRGPHTTVDVPEAFGLPSGPDVEFPVVSENKSRSGTRKTIIEEPLAYYPEMADICIELAGEAKPVQLPKLEVV